MLPFRRAARATRSAAESHSLEPAPAYAVAEYAQPIELGDGPVGVLLCHGFTGNPAAFRPWAEDLAAAGHRVSVPRLPGHGTDWRELNSTTWEQWYARLDEAYAELAARCDQVFVAGLSMGGALALRLAQEHGAGVAGLILVNPAIHSTDRRLRSLPVLSRVVPSFPAIGNDIAKLGADERAYPRTPLRALVSGQRLWQLVRRDLPRVTQPILLFRSVTDHVVDPSSAEILLAEAGSEELTERLLVRSFHVAILDYEADDIFAETREFVEAHRHG